MTQAQAQTPDKEPKESDFVTELRHLRREIKMLAKRVKAQHADAALARGREANEEVHANITLAYRHLEDAAMRLGKAIQAHDGGVSVYDQAEA